MWIAPQLEETTAANNPLYAKIREKLSEMREKRGDGQYAHRPVISLDRES